MKKKRGFTLIELLAVIVVLAIIMIIAIPNILNTMSTSKKQSLKVYAEKMFNEAQKSYEEKKLSGETPSTSYSIATLSPNQSKYSGTVTIVPGTDNTYSMKITITDGEFSICDKAFSALNDSSSITEGACS